MRSLKGILFRGVILGTAAVLLVAGIVLYLSVNAQLIRQMDEALTDKVEMLAASIEVKHYGLEVDLEEMGVEAMAETDVPEYLHIAYLDGRVLYQSPPLEDASLPEVALPVEEPFHEWRVIKGTGKLRSVLITYQPQVDDEEEDLASVIDDPGLMVDTKAIAGEPVVIRLLRDARGYSRFMEIFLLMLLATGLGSLGVLSLTIWLTIKTGAEPINELASRIEDISDDDLGVRLDEREGLKELAPIAHKFNLFLDRLEDSFDRERGFTSDAAHELRTPLAGLKSTLEVALSREREGARYREFLERSLEVVNQLENLVQSLLALARLESGQETAARSEVLLESCIRAAWSPCSDAAEKKHLVTSFEFHNGTRAVLDRNLFSQVMEELFRNAVHYVDDGGAVRVDLTAEEGRTRLRVGNTGSKVGAEEAQRVFDRFWRGSHSTDDTGVRFGLGLPIVRKIADTMGIKIEVESEVDGEFVVTLTIPWGDRSGIRDPEFRA